MVLTPTAPGSGLRSGPLLPPAERRRQPIPRPRRPWAGIVLWLVCTIAYSALGLVLNLKYNFTINDGLSRVANASYVLFGEDPHFSAIGFVWNPLPSILELPLVAARGLWQPLVTRGVAGVVMSATMMAGAVVQVRAMMRDRTQSRPWIVGITVCFALHPMILLYAGNGMSEAPYLLFTTWAVRRLIRWLNYDRVVDLASAGLALGLDYLTRYESLAAGIAAVVLVMVVAALRSEGTRSRRIANAAMDGAIVGFPIAMTFTFWTVASYVITGDAFLQFSSVYGNASQGAVGGLSAASGYLGLNSDTGGALGVVVRDLLSLEPLLFVIILVGIGFAVLRSDTSILAPLAVYGATLTFEAYGYLSKTTFPWLRFYLMAVPMAVVIAGTFKADEGYVAPWRPAAPALGSWRYRGPGATRRPIRLFRHYRLNVAVITAALLVPSFPVAAAAMLNPAVGLQEFTIRSVLDPARYPPAAEPEFQDYTGERELAAYLDSLHDPPGSVLVDTFLGWPIVMSSTDPDQFVITSDRDFSAALNDPRAFKISYLVVPDPSGYGSLDALNRRYPRLWSTGGGFATLVLLVPATGYSQAWRVYQLDPAGG